MKNNLPIICLLAILLICVKDSRAQTSLAERLKGRILLQAQSQGEAWYVNPGDLLRYYLARPQDSFLLMQKLSRGISNYDLGKIAPGLIRYYGPDSDSDGLADNLENALGTDKNQSDSDQDSFGDQAEILSGYDPVGTGKLKIDPVFSQKQAGYFFIQTEKNGECWYVNPSDNKRYYLGKPDDALAIMRQLSLGINEKDISQIAVGSPLKKEETAGNSLDSQNGTKKSADIDYSSIFYTVANSLISGNTDSISEFFVSEARTAVVNSMKVLKNEGKFMLGNLMTGANITEKSNNSIIYTSYIDFNGQKVKFDFRIKKQPDGCWLMENL